MFGRSRKKDDFEDEEYEDEEYEDEDEDDEDEYEDDEEYDDEDYDDEPRSLKGLVIGLVILAVLLAAIAGLLFMRLRSANAQVKDLTEQLNATRTELNTLLTEKTTATPAPEVTPEPTPEPDMVDATNGPEVVTPAEPEPAEPDMIEGGDAPAVADTTPAPAAEPTPAPTPAGTPDSQYIGINTSTTINITTNPEAKTVKAGQSATFTAAAANWKWCAWRFISPDGLHEIIFDKVNTKFAGVTTNGGNTTTFTVNNIPKDMDGWKAVCLFVDAGNGMKVTEGGTITVTD